MPTRQQVLSLTAITTVWLLLTLYNKWLILIPLLFINTLFIKIWQDLPICPLCMSFYLLEPWLIAAHLLGHSVVPLWLLAGMIAYSLSHGTEKLQKWLENEGNDFAFSWVLLVYSSFLAYTILLHFIA